MACRAMILAKKVSPRAFKVVPNKKGEAAGEIGIEGTTIEAPEEVGQLRSGAEWIVKSARAKWIVKSAATEGIYMHLGFRAFFLRHNPSSSSASCHLCAAFDAKLWVCAAGQCQASL